MFNLMKLDMEKIDIGGYIKKVIIADLIMVAIICCIMYIEKKENDFSIENYTMLFSMIQTMVTATFTIFASVLISKLVIEEYRNKTITVLFMYPLNRKKLILSKLLIVVIFTFISITVSSILISVCAYFFNQIVNLISGTLTYNIIFKNIILNIIYTVPASFIALIPLYFGMRKKSVSTTIVSSVILVSITNSNSGGFTINSIIIIPIILSAIGAFIAYMAIRNVENADLINN